MSTDVMIYANGLTKRYGSYRALDDVSFEVRRGEVVGFLGPNGAGKSTTMRILTCFIAPTSGMAKVRGHDVFEDTLAVRSSLGYLPQRAPLYLEMTVYEYLRFAAQMRNLDNATFKKRARDVVEICGLAQSLSKEIRQLSHGYRQRVGLAQALIHDPPILILDEPTSDLDPNEKAEFLNYLKQIGKDRTVLLSTHNLKEVETACARAIIVSRGRVVADGALDEIRAKSGRVRYVVSVQESLGESAYRGTGALPRGNDVEKALSSIRGVSKVAELPTDDRAHSFAVAGDDNTDLRPEIFRMVADKGWVLLELHRDTQTLEDVFRQLTIGDERRNRQLGPVSESRDEEDESDEDEDDSDDEEEDER
ncbi:ABC transporter, ATP-binding protein [Labilithrix luteola]|uniref:ABC transporter, ATP-binding protein n=1 Tax=Labilithrix luteola TaxID=1391654 RepID=A0A0K1PUB2_9BACT|nr:ATP-binding cassette domain-containing protein [Labilithrix luteola]AKU97125.1 ABC transporter, ATP-binding protein [Labilithrix luteola]